MQVRPARDPFSFLFFSLARVVDGSVHVLSSIGMFRLIDGVSPFAKLHCLRLRLYSTVCRLGLQLRALVE